MLNNGSGKPLASDIGHWAESKAADYLQAKGLKLVERNYRCRRGEIDLIMTDGEDLVFVEVKFRRQSAYGTGVDYFTQKKRNKLEAAIGFFLQQKRLNPNLIAHRIDVISMDNQSIQWYKAV